MSDIPSGADTLACARPAAPVKAGRLAAPICGVALTGVHRGALRSWAEGMMGAVTVPFVVIAAMREVVHLHMEHVGAREKHDRARVPG
jgi:hypothetical protein